MKLHDLLDAGTITEMVNGGYIRFQVHPDPTVPYAIINYTDKATYDRVWNDVTLACRGLIYDWDTDEIVARPFSKFFNYEQLGDDWVMPFGRVEVTDKQDGSLGILYPLPDGTWAVATRGSFASDQALHATKVFNERYASSVYFDPGITFLFEIVYPDNRIVLNYGQVDDLILLGAVVNETGYTVGPSEAAHLLDWTGPQTQVFDVRTFEEALALPPRDNAEGVVILFRDGTRVKFKQEDYVALHRIVTGMNDRVIWERLGSDESIDNIKEGLPEEFWTWVDDVADNLFNAADDKILEVCKEFWSIVNSLPGDFTRKDFALAVKDSPNKGYLFKYLDGQPIWDVVWKTLKPAATRSLVTVEEDE